MEERIKAHLDAHVATIETVARDLSEGIAKFAALVAAALRKGQKILVMGNGGSAADAQHLAAEFVGRFQLERKGLPALALTTDTSVLTSISNDYGFDEVFKRQVEALADPGDVVIGISTSGKSNNVFHALTSANEMNCTTVALLGRTGGNISDIADLALTVSVQETPLIQEAHITIIHLLCQLVENELSSSGG
ncbi:MAG: D-sedoheptulose 7-phosphate isomerase [Desulfuromonadales bacterium]|jgi:D-sedoheptulose 7-phosphate isomerase